MFNLKEQFQTLFEREPASTKSSSESLDRMTREIKGSMFLLLTLFNLVSLTSYLPLDSLSIFQGRFDHIHNLGGIVGALLSEWFLGTTGVVGYSVCLITFWMAVHCFRGSFFRENFVKYAGVLLATILGAITCFLVFSDSFPEDSLLQGGMLGRGAGSWLRDYFNTAGALLVMGGGFLVTLLLTTRFSILEMFSHFSTNETFEEDEEDEATPKKTAVTKKPKQVAKAKPTPKKRKKKNEDDEEDPAKASGEEETEETEEENTDSEGEKETGAEAIDPNEFKDLIPFQGSYSLPTLRLLKSDNGGAKKLSRGEMKATGEKLTEHLLSFQITGEVVSISQGPVLVTYEYKPSAGMKLSKIAGLQDDLGVVLGTRELRVIAPIPGKTVVGIEVPRPSIETIPLKDVLGEKAFSDKKLKLPIALGKLTDGTSIFADLTAMPHVLVAGATGSGKSVFVNCLIMSLLYRLPPDQLRMILIDPKMLELSVFDGIPHLLTNVITNNAIAYNALAWAVLEMERRYNLMAETNSKNIESYNSKQKKSTEKFPYIVIVVDELADLMLSGGEAVEIAITRLAQKARAAGIHLVIATQRPSTDVITGLIKANIPSRISFKVPSGIDSRTVLDESGAEELIGRGDGLMIQPGVPLRRFHACFVTEEELSRATKYLKNGKDHSKNYIQFSSQKPE